MITSFMVIRATKSAIRRQKKIDKLALLVRKNKAKLDASKRRYHTTQRMLANLRNK